MGAVSARRAVTMFLLAGHPQYVYYTGLITFLYTAMLLIGAKHRVVLATGYVTVFVGAAAIVGIVTLVVDRFG